jgi:DNA-binding LytR/AlgR family response regulator
MKIVIIEDEEFATRRLERMIHEIDPDIEIVAKLESVTDSIAWFKNKPDADLIFMDIHLEDNLSFAIFNSMSISCPIVFTTATDELSTRAFMLKKIDFLLKPIVQTELRKMIEKYRSLPFKERKTIDANFFTDIINSKK